MTNMVPLRDVASVFSERELFLSVLLQLVAGARFLFLISLSYLFHLQMEAKEDGGEEKTDKVQSEQEERRLDN